MHRSEVVGLELCKPGATQVALLTGALSSCVAFGAVCNVVRKLIVFSSTKMNLHREIIISTVCLNVYYG